MSYPNYTNNGQALAAGWDVAIPTDITAILGTDGVRFLPVNDRNTYTAGVIRNLPTASIWYSGMPQVQFVSPFITDGQIERLRVTYNGACTLRYHVPGSVGKTDTQRANGYLNLNLNQLTNLQRTKNVYRGFVWDFTITEILS